MLKIIALFDGVLLNLIIAINKQILGSKYKVNIN